ARGPVPGNADRDAAAGDARVLRTAAPRPSRRRSPGRADATPRRPRPAIPLNGLGGVRPRLLRNVRSAVADAADGLDQVLVLGTELRPEPADVDVDGSRPAVEVVAPHLSEECAAGEHAAGVLRQELQQFELLVREVEGA